PTRKTGCSCIRPPSAELHPLVVHGIRSYLLTPTSSSRSAEARSLIDDQRSPLTALRLAAPADVAAFPSVKKRTTSDANSRGSVHIRTPSERGIPSAPTGVVTTGRPAAIASTTFSLVPPPAKSGAMTTVP